VKVVVVMARALDAPADTIKTRLASALPDPADRAALHRACVADVLAAARGVDGALVRVAATSDGSPESFREVGVEPGHVFAQEGDDLGAREHAVFARMFRQGAHQVVLVGSDIPLLTTAILAEAFAALDADPLRVAIGPAADGGYYLMGLSGPAVPDLFSGVRWSTPYALADTLRRCEFENRRVAFLPVLEDVDTPEALERLRATLRAEPGRTVHAARTLAARGTRRRGGSGGT
jgi:rSAM/selenodomain-associated transferase 1